MELTMNDFTLIFTIGQKQGCSYMKIRSFTLPAILLPHATPAQDTVETLSYHFQFTAHGNAWGRRDDDAGIAYVLSALSPDHRDYLAAGGYGFIIGDGALSYAPEQITEGSYGARLFPSFTLTLDDQIVLNPAFNRDRGPVVNVVSLRGHVELEALL